MAKLIGKSKAGNMFKIEDTTNPKGYVWYFLAPNVLNFAKTIADGSEIEFKKEEKNGEDTITFITVAGGSKAPGTTASPAGAQSGYQPKTYGKSPEEQETIKRLSVLKTAADAVATAMQGQLDATTLGDMVEGLYDRFMAKIAS